MVIKNRQDFRSGDVDFDRLNYGYVDSPALEKVPDGSGSIYARAYEWLTLENDKFADIASLADYEDE
jgi:hypothetical protein